MIIFLWQLKLQYTPTVAVFVSYLMQAKMVSLAADPLLRARNGSKKTKTEEYSDIINKNNNINEKISNFIRQVVGSKFLDKYRLTVLYRHAKVPFFFTPFSFSKNLTFATFM